MPRRSMKNMSLKEGAFLNVLNEKVMYSHAEFVFNIAKRASVIRTLFRQ